MRASNGLPKHLFRRHVRNRAQSRAGACQMLLARRLQFAYSARPFGWQGIGVNFRQPKSPESWRGHVPLQKCLLA